MNIIWSEVRFDERDHSAELFYLLAEQGSTSWKFYERSAHELRWYEIPATEELVRKAAAETGMRLERKQTKKVRLLRVA